MIYSLVFLNVLITAFQGITTKFFSEHYPGKKQNSSIVFSVIVGILVSLSVSASGIIRPGGFTPTVILLGVLRSVTVLAYTFSLMTASAKGPYSQLTIFSMCGSILIPLFVDLCFGKLIEPFKYFAMAAMLSSFFLICRPAKDEEKVKKGFYVACMGIFVSNGLYGALTPIATYLEGDNMGHEIIISTYVSSALISVIMLTLKEKKDVISAFKLTKKSSIYVVLTSLIIASTSILGIVTLTGFGEFEGIDGALNMTLLCGGVTLASELLSLVMLKEKFTAVKWSGIALATASIVVLTL
ncbi:MAG: hypothetical protein E7613_07075 [Ruminococcaceae bacterium]|nr:hypothetical protein [Oscillospiraceae bacterium]